MKRNLYILLVNSLLLTLLSPTKTIACGFDFVGSCATSARFSANGVSTDYFVSTCAYGNVFAGANIGTNLTTLQITSANTTNWESCTNITKETAFYYRVFSDPLSKGGFLKVTLASQSVFNNPPYRTNMFDKALAIDLLAGLLPNTIYTIETYFEVSVDSDGNGSIDASKVANNAGSYFAASFKTGNINVATGFPVAITPTNVACFGGTTGAATAAASGGTSPYTYAWSSGATTATATALAAGSYSVTATDATGAKGIKSVSITQPSAFTVGLANTNPACLQATGAVTATALGGTSPYTFKWNNNATTATISSLAAGIFSVTVTDSKTCTATGSTVLVENCGGGGNYCTSASSAPWSEWISRVQLSTIDNASEKIRADKYVVGYSDWKDKATSLMQGGSYPLSITPGLSYPGLISNLYFRAWIDFNKNGIFETTEQVFEKNATSLAVTGPVSISATALLGSTVMRISMKKDAYPTACEAFAAGEVEDYTVVIAASNGNPCATDAIPPTFANCPVNVNLSTAATTAVATWTAPTATDNCTASPTITSNFNSGFAFPIGTTAVIYTAKDAANNASTCTFNVTVTSSNLCATDVTPPVFANCPTNIALTTTTTTAIATWTAPTATDNCTASPTITSNFNSGFAFPIGITAVIYTAKDAKNNTATCNFNVTVQAQTAGSTDIALTIASTPSVYSSFSTININITAKNVSTTALTNAIVEFKYPAGTVNGGTEVPSVGTWKAYCPGGILCYQWTIPSLAANATATLSVPLFVLAPTGPIVATTSLLSSSPTDNNAVNNTATVSIASSAPAVGALAQRKATQYLPVILTSIEPTLSMGEVTVNVESIVEKEVRFDFYNAIGKIVKSEKRKVELGSNHLLFEIYDQANGMYFIQTDVGLGRNAPIKFVKI